MINWGGSNHSSGNDFWQENLVIPETKLGEQLGGIRPLFSLSDPLNYFGTGTGLGKFPGPGYTDFEDLLGIGSYLIDFRPCPTGRRIESPSGMANHYQIPLRALVSENITNLMVANKTLAVDQFSNGAFWLHPTEWNAGLGAGAAAAVAVRHGVSTAHALLENKAWVREAQQEVIRAGGRVIWWSDALPASQPTPY